MHIHVIRVRAGISGDFFLTVLYNFYTTQKYSMSNYLI